MKKFILFIICLLLSFGVLTLSLITNSIVCTKHDDRCVFSSKIKYLNTELNREEFDLESIQKISCAKRSQPSKKGRKNYYILQINVNNRPYNIETFAKYKQCKSVANGIKQDIKTSSTDRITFTSASGVTNTLGIIFSFIILIIGVIILRTEASPQEEDEDEEM